MTVFAWDLGFSGFGGVVINLLQLNQENNK